METDEGNDKNKRAGRRSMWWRLQALNFYYWTAQIVNKRINLTGTTMYIGKILSLNCIDNPHTQIASLKEKFPILFIDDKKPPTADTLTALGFKITHFDDIQSIDQAEKYPIIACDIDGIGKKFTHNIEKGGYKVLKEIRKHYPDKYLIQYSTKSPDMDQSLTQADSVFPKDTHPEAWQDYLERALTELGNPKTRWIRLRNNLSEKGLDAYEIFKIEQAYIKSILNADTSHINNAGKRDQLNPEVRDIVIKFALTTAEIIARSLN